MRRWRMTAAMVAMLAGAFMGQAHAADEGAAQKLMSEFYFEGEPSDARGTFLSEDGELMAVVSYSVGEQDGQVVYQYPLARYVDHFRLTGQMYEPGVTDDYELVLDGMSVSLQDAQLIWWRKADPDLPACFQQVVMSRESVYEKLVDDRQILYDGEGAAQVAFYYDAWGSLERIAWGDALAQELQGTRQETLDEAGNTVITRDIRFAASLDGAPMERGGHCVLTCDPEGRILSYEYTGVSSPDRAFDMTELECRYEYDEDGQLTRLHRIRDGVSEEIWYYAAGDVRMRYTSEEGWYFYYYDEAGELQEIDIDRSASAGEYAGNMDLERIRSEINAAVEAGAEGQSLEICRLGEDNRAFSAAILSEGRRTYDEYVFSPFAIGYMSGSETEISSKGSVREQSFQLDDLRMPTVITQGDRTTDYYQAEEDPATGKRSYYQIMTGQLVCVVWSEWGAPEEAFFLPEE